MYTVEYCTIDDFVGNILHKEFNDYAVAKDFFLSLAFDDCIELAELYTGTGIADYRLLDAFITSGEYVK